MLQEKVKKLQSAFNKDNKKKATNLQGLSLFNKKQKVFLHEEDRENND